MTALNSLVFSLSAIRDPLGISFYFQAIMCFLGAVFIAKNWVINKNLIPFLLMVVLNILGSLIHFTKIPNPANVAYLVSLIFCISWLTRQPQSFFLQMARHHFLWVATFFVTAEMVVEGAKVKTAGGLFDWIMVFGPCGDSNYSAFAYGAMVMILALAPKSLREHGDKWRILLYLIFIIMAFCRGVILALAVVFALALVKRVSPIFRGLSNMASFAIVLGILSIPLSFPLLDLFLTKAEISWLNGQSTDRLFLWKSHINLGWEFPLGVGVSNSAEAVYMASFLNKVKQAHNTMVQVFSEFGIVGYFLFCIYIVRLYFISVKKNLASMMVFLLVSATFLNALSFFAYVLISGFVLSDREEREDKGIEIGEGSALAKGI